MPAQPTQGVRARLTGDDALEDAATVDPVGDPAENAADAHPAPVQDLLDAQLRARPLFDQRAAVAAQPPQVAEALRQHQARAPEAELADARQPDAVRDIGLAPLDLLDVPGVDHHDIETGVGQNVVDLLPVDARRFHDGAAHPQAEQPLHQKGEAARQCAERAGLDKGAFPARVGAHGRGDLHLVDVEPRGDGVTDFHVIVFGCIAHDPTPVELRLTGDGWRQARLWGLHWLARGRRPLAASRFSPRSRQASCLAETLRGTNPTANGQFWNGLQGRKKQTSCSAATRSMGHGIPRSRQRRHHTTPFRKPSVTFEFHAPG